MQDICALMGVSRSGYYKWKKREKSERDLKREEMIALVSQVHEEHPSHGYRWVAAYIRINHGYQFSDNYIYKAFRYLEIKAETKHQEHYNPVNESLNGWIKEELYMDFKIDQCRSREEFKGTMEKYVEFYNNMRPCYAIGYDTPVNYRKRYYKVK